MGKNKHLRMGKLTIFVVALEVARGGVLETPEGADGGVEYLIPALVTRC